MCNPYIPFPDRLERFLSEYIYPHMKDRVKFKVPVRQGTFSKKQTAKLELKKKASEDALGAMAYMSRHHVDGQHAPKPPAAEPP